MIGSQNRAFKQQPLLYWTICGPQSLTEAKVNSEAFFIHAVEPATSVDLPEEVSTALRVLTDAMYSTCALHNVDFGELEDLYGLEHGKKIRELANFVLADLPYSVGRNRDDKNLKHNRFSAGDMKAMMRN